MPDLLNDVIHVMWCYDPCFFFFSDMGSQEEDGGIAEKQLKIVLVGDSGSGKVSLIDFIGVFIAQALVLHHHYNSVYCFLNLHSTLRYCKLILMNWVCYWHMLTDGCLCKFEIQLCNDFVKQIDSFHVMTCGHCNGQWSPEKLAFNMKNIINHCLCPIACDLKFAFSDSEMSLVIQRLSVGHAQGLKESPFFSFPINQSATLLFHIYNIILGIVLSLKDMMPYCLHASMSR